MTRIPCTSFLLPTELQKETFVEVMALGIQPYGVSKHGHQRKYDKMLCGEQFHTTTEVKP